MIVIGVDVHKHSLTVVAVDEAGRMLDERTVAAADDGLLAWASALSSERLWALEDCWQLTRSLERQLLSAGEELVRVPPKADGAGASCRPGARQVRPDRRAGRRESRAAGAEFEPSATG
jgi:transposase